MQRFITKKLISWKNSKDRKPLILKGARQVGKTYILKEFGMNNYDNVAYFNFDHDNEFIINGGILIAVGYSGMLQTPSLDSKINIIVITLDTYSESAINVTDSSGNSLITFKPSKQYNSFIYASPNIKINESYNININGNESGENKDGIYQGVYQNGELLENVTINSVITKVGSMKSMGNTNRRFGR